MVRERLVQGRHDETTGAGEDLVSAPDHIIRRVNHGVQGTADEPKVEQSLPQRIVDQAFIAADQIELDVRIGAAPGEVPPTPW